MKKALERLESATYDIVASYDPELINDEVDCYQTEVFEDVLEQLVKSLSKIGGNANAEEVYELFVFRMIHDE